MLTRVNTRGYEYLGILKFFHLSTHHVGGSFLEVKNFKNPNRKVVFHPNIFFKIHQFLVISLICGVSWSVHWPQGVYMRLITKKMNFSKSILGGKPLLGHDF